MSIGTCSFISKHAFKKMKICTYEEEKEQEEEEGRGKEEEGRRKQLKK